MSALADAGYRVAAMDLRGYGASDKPPRGYDTLTLAADVASVIRSLGERTRGRRARLGRLDRLVHADAAARRDPRRRVAVDAAPAGLARRASFTSAGQIRANAYLAGLQRPFVPERQMTVHGGYVERAAARVGLARGRSGRRPRRSQRYADAMALPFVAHSAAEYYRWVGRAARLRPDGWRFAAPMRTPIAVPVLQLHGERDGAVLPGRPAGRRHCVHRPLRAPPRSPGRALPARGGARRGQRPTCVRWLDRSADRLAARESQPATQAPVSTGAVARGRVEDGRGLVQGQGVAGAGVVERLGEDDADDPAVGDSSGPPELPGSHLGVERVDLAHGAGRAVDVGAAGVEDRRGPAPRRGGRDRRAGSRRPPAVAAARGRRPARSGRRGQPGHGEHREVAPRVEDDHPAA